MASEMELVGQLKERRTCAYEHLYKLYYPTIEKYILSNSGSVADAEDIFQETLLILTDKIQKQDFALSSSLKTYLYSISRNLWLKVLNKRKNIQRLDTEEKNVDHLKDSSEEEREGHLKLTSFIERIISKLPHHCQQIIDYVFYKNATPEQTAEELGYNNNHTVSNAKYKCIQHLKKASDKKELTL
jgi:RNA polymerase sigma factor (sigma-70 family)